MLDKLVDNATGFAPPGTAVRLGLTADRDLITLSVDNPGPPLPEQLKGRLFDSLVSVRSGDDRHLGLGLYIARLIAEGHGGTITADNTDEGVRFEIRLPRVD
jgi:signal transduction histidine kinase